MKSKPLSLNQTDWPVSGMAFVFGLGLHVAEYVVEFATATDFGSLTPLVSVRNRCCLQRRGMVNSALPLRRRLDRRTIITYDAPYPPRRKYLPNRREERSKQVELIPHGQ